MSSFLLSLALLCAAAAGFFTMEFRIAYVPEAVPEFAPPAMVESVVLPESKVAPHKGVLATFLDERIGWKPAIATVFWAGEVADKDNGFIPNTASAWNEEWSMSFGGYDDPNCRDGYHPCDFTPKENPFYIALPYNDLDDMGHRKENARRIPWYEDGEGTLLKNRWIAVRTKDIVCFAQWADVGPFQEDDIEYVFGSAPAPLNTQLEKAGIDLSPALRDCLRVGGLSRVEWRFLEEKDVPNGPWKEITTR